MRKLCNATKNEKIDTFIVTTAEITPKIAEPNNRAK